MEEASTVRKRNSYCMMHSHTDRQPLSHPRVFSSRIIQTTMVVIIFHVGQ